MSKFYMPEQESQNSLDQVVCPKCGEFFPVSEAIKHSLAEQIEKESEKRYAEREKNILAQAKKLKEQEAKLLETQQSIDQQVQEQLKQERPKMELTAKKKAEEDLAVKLLDAENQIKEKDRKIEENRKKELELLQRTHKLEEAKKDLEVEVVRRVDTERKKIEEIATEKVLEEHRLTDKEKEIQMVGMRKQIEDLKRKAEQGSQQLQGEAQELDLEELLKDSFPSDNIQPVAKGVGGADVLQGVYTPRGSACGAILWESKRTKNWNEEWITKLKDDQREAKADLAVFVTETLPKDISSFGPRNGVWITKPAFVFGVANLLRSSLIRVAQIKLAAESKDEKMEVLFRYLTGPEFTQRVQAAVETFNGMKQDLDKEKRLTITRWAKREKDMGRVIAAIAGMHGDLQGLIGPSMQSIPALEAGELEEDNEEEESGETSSKYKP
ncbi:MAG TPA: DUF2130 domain-containing protein [Candidatus Wildermuthbacteria bacterium]|uniref:DUF2130 domain-containing protein n=2 Tax=Parcubacteria group TaxID=1794811 RepID=A0A837INC2_9BACT|nr:MAG: hypothetical protein UY25_C0001G0121 [Candidatus Yanofskybacteria bacterium GW2011_GWC1_48_11]KKW03904.1 MAG: hypothetical protein UY38_C0002G0058 [Parcubacteria group bacterium GW2011_GWB1_49_12]KKW08534.1 MAG: hypothetical protein UY45_C0006G0020 [Parcubacteria group bacterium GW2011_GWA1_49_26]KKW14010.1 MAG: hypothetical protein UY53_C0004G0061 [Parcubacteria group bacterium GW2011_GWA2_50_10]HCM36666.1 DUF2130 domain-containing protein [Candidatus Wildermuthbacteria bacterium]